MIYKVSTLKKKHIASLNKDVLDCELLDEQGKKYPKIVSIWPEFPFFEAITFESTVEGEIVVNDKGYASLKSGSRAIKPNYKGAQIEAAQERKAGFIKEAQGRKEESIAFFNATNSSIALLASKNLDGAELRLKIKEWRDWFLQEWKEYDKKPYESKHEAF